MALRVHKRYRGLVPDGAARASLIAVPTPFLHFCSGFIKADEPVSVQAFGPELAIDSFMKALSVGLPGREKSHITLF